MSALEFLLQDATKQEVDDMRFKHVLCQILPTWDFYLNVVLGPSTGNLLLIAHTFFEALSLFTTGHLAIIPFPIIADYNLSLRY